MTIHGATMKAPSPRPLISPAPAPCTPEAAKIWRIMPEADSAAANERINGSGDFAPGLLIFSKVKSAAAIHALLRVMYHTPPRPNAPSAATITPRNSIPSSTRHSPQFRALDAIFQRILRVVERSCGKKTFGNLVILPYQTPYDCKSSNAW